MDTQSVVSIKKMKSAVVQITYSAEVSGRPVRSVAGTGFLVSQGPYAITNAHVITSTLTQLQANQATNIGLTIGLPIPDQTGTIVIKAGFMLVPFEVVELDAAHDIALLKLGRDPFKGEMPPVIATNRQQVPLEVSAARLEPEVPQEGTTLLVSGYPLAIPTLVTQSGIVASQSFQMIERAVPGAPPWFTMPEVADALLMDASVNPGNSGGPVYLPGSGAVVGICQAYMFSPICFQDGEPVVVERGGTRETAQQSAGIAVVIPIRYAIALLDKHGVAHAP